MHQSRPVVSIQLSNLSVIFKQELTVLQSERPNHYDHTRAPNLQSQLTATYPTVEKRLQQPCSVHPYSGSRAVAFVLAPPVVISF